MTNENRLDTLEKRFALLEARVNGVVDKLLATIAVLDQTRSNQKQFIEGFDKTFSLSMGAIDMRVAELSQRLTEVAARADAVTTELALAAQAAAVETGTLIDLQRLTSEKIGSLVGTLSDAFQRSRETEARLEALEQRR